MDAGMLLAAMPPSMTISAVPSTPSEKAEKARPSRARGPGRPVGVAERELPDLRCPNSQGPRSIALWRRHHNIQLIAAH